ncbi:cytochrome c oxidase subunit 3 family protein [bacterium]|jgi:cytochrome c oxidase subunit III|nr:cytochrome c oxidase subunit 3 family protein [bacterium]
MATTGTSFIKHEVAHHFDNAEQEFESAKLGMWAFMAQEILFFSALFVAYAIFRYLYPEAFLEASSLLSWKMGAFNTAVLITSSFTMVMAVNSAQTSQKKKTFNFLLVTILLAALFLVVKYFEYMSKFHHGIFPPNYFNAMAVFEQVPIFFGIYFVITGLHALHILIGIGLIIWIMRRTARGEFHADYFTPVELVGLYWHFVDLVWIFLFPLLYLVG